MKPNIFDYATSELSQDAFLAWFFQWAAEDNKKIDSKLQKCAENALREFFGNVNLPPKINSIYADTQYKHIDLWITVNDDYHLIIEDKTKTSMHDNQLQRYRETAEKWYDSEKGTDFKKHFSFVYYKTGYLSQDEINFAKQNEYKVITKDTLLKIIEDYSGNNIIISDYKELLLSKFSEQELVYKTPVKEILKNKDWVKPFHESLKDDLDTPRHWKKIFMGWYWCSDSIGEFNLQLNGFDLLIQFSPKSDKDENIEKAVAKINAAMKKFPGYKKSFIQKTSGNTIFKIHQEKWLVINESGCIDRVKTLENLHKYEDFLWLKALGHKK